MGYFLKDELWMANAQESSHGGGLQVCVVSCMLLCWQRLSFTKQAHWPLKKSHDTTRDNTLFQQNGSKSKQWAQWTFETNQHRCPEWDNPCQINVSWANSFDHLWGIWYAAAPLGHFGRTRLGLATKFDSSAWVLRNTGVKICQSV